MKASRKEKVNHLMIKFLKANGQFITFLKITIILLGITFYLYYGVYKILYVNFSSAGIDFSSGYYAAQDFAKGHNVYGRDYNHWYLPLDLLLFSIFDTISLHQAILIWLIVSQLLALLSFCLLYKSGSKTNPLNSVVAITSSLCLSMPLYQNIVSGNINILIFAGMCLTYYLIFSGRTKWIPIVIALLTAVKIYPAFLMSTFVRTRNYNVLKMFFLFSVLILLLSIYIFGLKMHYSFLTNLPNLSNYVGKYHCLSLSFVMGLVLHREHANIIFVSNLLFCVGLLILWWKSAQRSCGREFSTSSTIVDLSILTVILVMVLPSSWLFYHSLFIPVFYFIILIWLQDRKQLRFVVGFFCLFFSINFWEIIMYQIPLAPDGVTFHQIDTNRESYPLLYPIIASIPFLLNVLFFIWLLINYRGLRDGVAALRQKRNTAFHKF